MGANAQTTVPDFVAETVLTAAKLDISAATGVPVFATTVTRDAAFGGANKVLAEGQTCYLESTNVVQYYDGAAWATVGPAAAGGLVTVKAETAFTATGSFIADSVFTSAYTNYLIKFNFSVNALITMKLRVAAASASTNYNHAQYFITGTSIAVSTQTGQTSFSIATNSGAAESAAEIFLYGPQLAKPTTIQSNNTWAATTYGNVGFLGYSGNHSTATAYDGVEILTAGSMTGTYTIYGFGKTL